MAASLEKKAEKNILDSIDKLVTNSFLMLLFESMMVKNHPVLKDALKDNGVKGIYNYVNQVISSIQHIIDEGGDEKEFRLKKALQMKQQLLEVYDNLKIGISACGIIDLCIEERIQILEGGKDDDIPLAELKRLLKQETSHFLSDAVKHDVEEAASSILFTILPNSFSDRELIDYVSYSGQFYYENSSQKMGDCHKQQIMRSFAPQKMPDFGKYYSKESEKLLELIDAINVTEPVSAFKKLVDKYDRISSKIEGIADILSSLYTELTYISIILSSMFTFEDILKGNKIYSDYYNKTSELINADKLDEVMTEAILTSLDKTIEKEVGQLNELAKRKELLYKNVNFESFSENTKTLLSMEFFMTSAFFENIEDASNPESNDADIPDRKIVNPKEVQKEMRALKVFIKENCLGMNEALKKSARRNLFLSVPLVSSYDKEKMMSYINDLCSKVKYASEIEESISSIQKLIEEEVLVKISIFEN